MSQQNQVTVVPHTHWDREWYQPFSVFQARLIEAVDAVLDVLATDPSYRHFMLDGQAVVLEDYLALRPEAQDVIRGHVESGRLAIGPWYTLADEFLASPEALVRNLQIGIETCRRFGEAMPVVYTPDSFGHVSQLPLLAAEFGFDSVVFERGVGDEGERLGGEFRWCSVDGKQSVLAVHLLTTYSSAAGIGYQDWSRYDGFDPERATAHARKALYGGDVEIGMEAWLDDSLGRIPGGSNAYASGSHLLLLNGSDHLPPQRNLPEVVSLLNQNVEGASFRLGRLREYIDGVLEQAHDLPQHRGEFRGSRYHHVLSGVFSARMYLKQANHRAERWLERYAEPMSSLASIHGAPYPSPVLTGAWKELLKNHCHDSICGCSIDQVHDEMLPRFDSVSAVSRHLCRKATAHLSGGYWSVPPPPMSDDRLPTPKGTGLEPARLTAFNPHPRTWQGVLEARLPLPDGFEPHAIVDASGTRLPASIGLETEYLPGESRLSETVAAVRWLAELPALSLNSFRLVASEAGGQGRDSGDVERADGSAIAAAVRAAGRVLENEYLRVEVEASSLQLHHKPSGERYALRLYLEDSGDAGDEYDYSPVPGEEPRLWDLLAEVDAGGDALEGVLRSAGELRIPQRLADDRSVRQGDTVLPFEVRLRLCAADPFVRLELDLENRSLDHRLRLVVDSDIASDHVAAEGHFDVLERPLAAPRAEGWFQTPSGTNHQRRFLAFGDGEHGLAVLNEGLPEYGASASGEGTRVAVTLLRSVGWLSRNDLISRPEGAGPAIATPGAQCLGGHRFDLALMPYAGSWDMADVPEAAERFSLAPFIEATPDDALGESLLELPRGLLLSALKRARQGDGLVVRLWNPGNTQIDDVLTLARAPRSAALVNFDERPLRELPAAARVDLSVRPKEVLTLLLNWNPSEPSGGEAMA